MARLLVTFRAARQTRHSLCMFDVVSVRNSLTFLSARWRGPVNWHHVHHTSLPTSMGGKTVTVAPVDHDFRDKMLG